MQIASQSSIESSKLVLSKSAPRRIPTPVRHASAFADAPLSESTGLQAHDLTTQGVSVGQAKHLLNLVQIISEAQVYAVLGISPKTMQRRAASASKTLDANASDRAMRLMSMLQLATEVLGSQDAAERWLTSPAIGLDGRLPIDLLPSSQGTEMVKTLLNRMDYGVYA